ncbi:MAG: GNAT family N-acetyltransferase [Burkholderiaceae bacterium]|nr:GNAT family N-acetyltransferase [Burkholderiaceae bacterium]
MPTTLEPMRAHVEPARESHSQARLSLHLARTAADLADAQRLRFKVFAEELGAQVTGQAGHDADAFDDYCDHLLVRDDDTLRVVGTYRILPPHRARQIGRLYADGEFDLARLAHLRPSLIEVGRSCVHRDYRSGATILMLWAGLAQYMKLNGYQHLIGCASVPLTDGGRLAAWVRDATQPALVSPEYRAFPRLPFPHARIEPAGSHEMPPLLRGYLRIGAQICGEPAWDPDFNTADFLVWLPLERMNRRYARHFDLLAQQSTLRPA